RMRRPKPLQISYSWLFPRSSSLTTRRLCLTIAATRRSRPVDGRYKTRCGVYIASWRTQKPPSPNANAQEGRQNYSTSLQSAFGLAARRSGGRRQLVIGDAPNGFNAAARANEQRGRSQCYERQKQGVLNEVLPLIVHPKVAQVCHFDSLLSFRLLSLCDRSITSLGFRDLAITACSAANSSAGNC